MALDSVDAITHSTGGLISRSYIQSLAYNQPYGNGKTLPKINNLVQSGVPNQGASTLLNLIENDFSDKSASRVMGRVLDIAYDYLLAGRDILNPDNSLMSHSLNKFEFIRAYVNVFKDLLAAYPFADLNGTSTYSVLTTGNSTSLPGGAVQNDLVFDLNATVAQGQAGGPNAFVDLVLGTVTIVYSNAVDTKNRVSRQTGFQPALLLNDEILPFDQLIGNIPTSTDAWLLDFASHSNGLEGDGTVPAESAWGLSPATPG